MLVKFIPPSEEVIEQAIRNDTQHSLNRFREILQYLSTADLSEPNECEMLKGAAKQALHLEKR